MDSVGEHTEPHSGEQGHPSWDRDCPTFIAKRREMDSRTPDNLLTYFPTDEA